MDTLIQSIIEFINKITGKVRNGGFSYILLTLIIYIVVILICKVLEIFPSVSVQHMIVSSQIVYLLLILIFLVTMALQIFYIVVALVPYIKIENAKFLLLLRSRIWGIPPYVDNEILGVLAMNLTEHIGSDVGAKSIIWPTVINVTLVSLFYLGDMISVVLYFIFISIFMVSILYFGIYEQLLFFIENKINGCNVFTPPNYDAGNEPVRVPSKKLYRVKVYGFEYWAVNFNYLSSSFRILKPSEELVEVVRNNGECAIFVENRRSKIYQILKEGNYIILT